MFRRAWRALRSDRALARVSRKTFTVRTLADLHALLGWQRMPRLDHAFLGRTEHLTDLNRRRLRDAEVLGSACCNGDPKVLLEIGTAHGEMTAVMAENAPAAHVFTVNIPPEEIEEGGTHVTFAPDREAIGRYARERGLSNVTQILANTKHWEPAIGTIDVAFIDGCHDADFVFHDTRKVLEHTRPGSLVLWHDFSPPLARHFRWIEDVCTGVERLYRKGLLRGEILHLEDSFTGLYRVPPPRGP